MKSIFTPNGSLHDVEQNCFEKRSILPNVTAGQWNATTFAKKSKICEKKQRRQQTTKGE